MRVRYLLLVLAVGTGGCDDKKSEPVGEAKTNTGKEGDALNPVDEYRRKSIAIEAKVELKRMADAAKSSFLEAEVDPETLEMSRSLPTSTPVTPAAGACCKQPKGRCAVYPESWIHPTWQRLDFELTTSHYFSYEFVSKEDGFIARAIGDLDCDGTRSNYEIEGKIDGDNITLSELRIENELE